MEKTRIIYFLCTGNSCRSQIAEAFAKKYFSEQFAIYSGGIEAHGLHPFAIKVMAEVGMDISDQSSDTIDLKIITNADYIITLCGDANGRCPVTPPNIYREHWELIDPAKAKGTDEQILGEFRNVRDIVEKNVRNLARQMNCIPERIYQNALQA